MTGNNTEPVQTLNEEILKEEQKQEQTSEQKQKQNKSASLKADDANPEQSKEAKREESKKEPLPYPKDNWCYKTAKSWGISEAEVMQEWNDTCIANPDKDEGEIKNIILEKHLTIQQQQTSSESAQGNKGKEKNIDAIEVDSIDKIPIPERKTIPPISFDGLPVSGVRDFVEYMSGLSDTYPEYSFQAALAMTAAVSKARVVFVMQGRSRHINLREVSLGQAAKARKNGPLNESYSITYKAVGDVFIGGDPSKEGIVGEMADEIKSVKDGTTKINNRNNGSVRRAVCSFFKNEAGGWLASHKQKWNDGIRNVINDFYDAGEIPYIKPLCDKRPVVDTPYWWNSLINSTPRGYLDHVTYSDVETGYVPRDLIAWPNYKKNRKPMSKNGNSDPASKDNLVMLYKMIDSLLPDKLVVSMSDELIAWYDTWVAEREDYFDATNNEGMGSFMGRQQYTPMKMAILIELSSLPFYIAEHLSRLPEGSVLNNKFIINVNEIFGMIRTSNLPKNTIYAKINKLLNNYNINSYEVSRMSINPDVLLYCTKVFDNVFIPYMSKILQRMSCSNLANYLDDFYKYFEIHPIIEQSILRQNMHVKSKEMLECIESMKDAGVLKHYEVKGITKPINVFTFTGVEPEKFPLHPLEKFKGTEDLHIELRKKAPKPPVIVDSKRPSKGKRKSTSKQEVEERYVADGIPSVEEVRQSIGV